MTQYRDQRKFRIVGKEGNDAVTEDSLREKELSRIKSGAKKRKMRVVIVSLIALGVLSFFVVMSLSTYSRVEIVSSFKDIKNAEGRYAEFSDGFLKYSMDGISYYDDAGKEKWNYAYQMNSPIAVTCEGIAAVADKGGKSIIIFDSENKKGEINTTLPIQKVSVSRQGIVCALLQDDELPRVVCYDSEGRVLVEHRSLWEGKGYPVDADISTDGSVLQVAYLYVGAGKVRSSVLLYDLNNSVEEKEAIPKVSVEKIYEETIMAEVFFLNGRTSVAMGDNKMIFFHREQEGWKETVIRFDKEIKSVFHSRENVGVILRSKNENVLCIYNEKGELAHSQEIKGEYSSARMCGNEVILFDEKRCLIILDSGLTRFDGEIETGIIEMFPVFGINKYILINTSGVSVVRLVG